MCLFYSMARCRRAHSSQLNHIVHLNFNTFSYNKTPLKYRHLSDVYGVLGGNRIGRRRK